MLGLSNTTIGLTATVILAALGVTVYMIHNRDALEVPVQGAASPSDAPAIVIEAPTASDVDGSAKQVEDPITRLFRPMSRRDVLLGVNPASGSFRPHQFTSETAEQLQRLREKHAGRITGHLVRTHMGGAADEQTLTKRFALPEGIRTRRRAEKIIWNGDNDAMSRVLPGDRARRNLESYFSASVQSPITGADWDGSSADDTFLGSASPSVALDGFSDPRAASEILALGNFPGASRDATQVMRHMKSDEVSPPLYRDEDRRVGDVEWDSRDLIPGLSLPTTSTNWV